MPGMRRTDIISQGRLIMKNLRRYIFNAIAVLSLLLFFVSALLWVRSYFASDLYQYVDDPAAGVDDVARFVSWRWTSRPYRGR